MLLHRVSDVYGFAAVKLRNKSFLYNSKQAPNRFLTFCGYSGIKQMLKKCVDSRKSVSGVSYTCCRQHRRMGTCQAGVHRNQFHTTDCMKQKPPMEKKVCGYVSKKCFVIHKHKRMRNIKENKLKFSKAVQNLHVGLGGEQISI